MNSHLQTGGKAIPGGKSLWQFSAGAIEVLDKRAQPPFVWGTPMRDITNTDVTINSVGALQPDGTYWTTLPDGADLDVTPTVNTPYAADTPQNLSWDDNPTKHVDHSDSPGYGPGLCDSVSVDDHFETYLQFQPPGGIAVTIDRIDWGWSCSATESGGIWTSTSSTNGPTEDRDDDSFPVWPNIYFNSR